MLQAAENQLEKLYHLLNLQPSAKEREIREAFSYLARIWHYDAVNDWKTMGIATDPKDNCNLAIFNCVRMAFIILTDKNLTKEYLNGNSFNITPLETEILKYKEEVENQFYTFLKSKQKQKAVKTEKLFDLSDLPHEILQPMFAKVDNQGLAYLASFSSVTGIAREQLWPRLIKTEDKFKLFQYFSVKVMFIPKTLDVTFSPEVEGAYAVPRLIPYKSMRAVLPPHLMYGIAEKERKDFKSTAAYHAYLMSNPQAVITASTTEPLLFDSLDGNGVNLRQKITGKMSVFHVLTTAVPYHRMVFLNLQKMVKMGTKLPDPFKTRNHFESTAEYFEYLICNVHDLFIALHENPSLINERDENGQTLLFYPVVAARYLSKRCIQWVMDILTSVPILELEIKDHNGDTCVHWTTKYCTEKFENTENHDREEDHLIFNYVFTPLVKLAKKRHFCFEVSLNNQGMSLLHIAADLPSEKPNAVSSLLNLLIGSRNYDFYDLLSGENYSALYYAVKHAHLEKINRLRILTRHSRSSTKEIALLLQDMIFHRCQEVMKDLGDGFVMECPAGYSDKRGQLVSNILEKLRMIRELHYLFKLMVLKLGSKVKIGSEDAKAYWLNSDMIQYILTRYKNLGWGGNLSLTLGNNRAIAERVVKKLNCPPTERDPAGILYTLVWDLGCQGHPLIKIMVEVFKEELDQLILDVHSTVVQDKEETDLKQLKRLLSVKLLELEKAKPEKITNELIEYFNKITSSVCLKDCNILFEFLLSHQVNAQNTSSLWQQSVKRHINWPALIEGIRVAALEKVGKINELMGYDQAIRELAIWRDYAIFNLPNGYFESVGRTRAVVILDNLRERRVQEKSQVKIIQSHI